MLAVPPPGMMAAAGRQPQQEEVPPSQTLYVSGLTEKLKRKDLQKMLYNLFSVCGPIIEVVALKTNKMRGQAFVIYKDIQSATRARRELHGFMFYGRPMRVNFAREKSHLIAKLDGTFDEAAFETRRQQRLTEDEQKKEERKKRNAMEGLEKDEEAAEREREKRRRADQNQAEVPSNTLFVQDLPPESNELVVQMLFQQFPGYRSVRLVEGQGMAFVEFADLAGATVAKNSLQNFRVKDEHLLRIQFAKL